MKLTAGCGLARPSSVLIFAFFAFFCGQGIQSWNKAGTVEGGFGLVGGGVADKSFLATKERREHKRGQLNRPLVVVSRNRPRS